MTMRTEILEKFTSNNPRWKSFNEVFYIDGWAYGGNGFILFRVRSDKPNTIGAPEIVNVFNDTAWPLVDPVKLNLDCFNGVSFKECQPEKVCEDCDGDGYLECNLGHEHDCETCDGTGMVYDPDLNDHSNCKYCEKTGLQIFRENEVVFLGQLCSGGLLHYIAETFNDKEDLLCKLGSEEKHNGHIVKKIYFQAGEFQGVLMPIVKKLCIEYPEIHPLKDFKPCR